MKIFTLTTTDDDDGTTATLHLSRVDAYSALRANYAEDFEWPESDDNKDIDGLADFVIGQSVSFAVDEHEIGPSADQLHVILDCLQYARQNNIPEHFSAGYDDPDDNDPKGTPEGWERTRAEAETAVGDLLSHA